MARVPELLTFCQQHDLKIISIAKLIEHRLQRESQVKRFVSVDLPTDYGEFKLIGYESQTSAEPHLALCKGGVGDLDASGQPKTSATHETARVLRFRETTYCSRRREEADRTRGWPSGPTSDYLEYHVRNPAFRR